MRVERIHQLLLSVECIIIQQFECGRTFDIYVGFIQSFKSWKGHHNLSFHMRLTHRPTGSVVARCACAFAIISSLSCERFIYFLIIIWMKSVWRNVSIEEKKNCARSSFWKFNWRLGATLMLVMMIYDDDETHKKSVNQLRHLFQWQKSFKWKQFTTFMMRLTFRMHHLRRFTIIIARRVVNSC